MMIVSAQSAALRDTPVEMLPLRLRKYFYCIDSNDVYEIRLRRGLPLGVTTVYGKKYITPGGRLTDESGCGITVSGKDIDEAVDILTSSSLYSYKDEINSGFITAPGGHRVGICGTVTADGGFMTDILGLNYRFAREVVGCADNAASVIFNKGDIKSTLILSKPGCGKTTFLRDLIRQVSDKGVNVSVVDERGEIGAVCNGMPGFDLGKNTDILSMCNKRKGMELMLRTMSPRVIAVDEFDKTEDFDFISKAASSGVGVFATIHCGDWKSDISKNVLEHFKCIVVLSDRRGPGTVEEIVHV